MAASKESPGGVVVARFNGAWVPQVHALFAFVAFFSALVVACWTDYRAIVKNQYWGYPEEWFPSVSATTGDRYPARPIFQIFMAINSGPRFLLLYLFYLYSSSNSNGVFPKVHAVVGLLRTLSCGGWVYITSSEDHGTHDIAMVSYLVLTIPWMLGALTLSQNPKTKKWRKIVTCVFFGSLVPTAYQFYQHKANRVAGAYSIYALFEWGLIIYDVLFDAISLYDFNTLELAVIDVSRQSRKVVATSSIAEKATDGTTNIETLLKIGDWNNLREFIVDVYLAFVHWSMLTSLAVTIWYFPLWHMGLSGYEVTILVTCVAGLLGIRPIRDVVRSYKGYIQLASLVGVAAYLIKDPVSRLLTVTFGLALNILVWTSKWVENTDDPGRLERESLVWLLGLILSNVVKMAWWANNPIWPIMHAGNGGANGTGLFLAILASIEVIRRNDRTPPPTEKTIRPDKWFASAAGFGSLLFAFHCLLSDTSTITRWVYNGYPDTGPMPVPWGALTIVAMSMGVILSTSRKFATGLPWYAFACVACGCMYYFPGWKGYYGGFALAVYLVSVAPSFIRSVAYSPPGKTFLTAMVIYIVLCLANIWTVAYAFVPAGEYLREHTDYVLILMMGLIGLGVHSAGRSYSFKHAHVNVTRYSRYYTKLFLGVLIVLSTLIMLVRMPRAPPVPYHPEDKLLTAGIWTIHFALDNDMWASEVRMKDAIKELELDVIGLLESDLGRTIMGNRDLTQFLGEELDMYADYGPGPSKHTWGCTMLSKFPILRSTHHLLPSPVGELACAIHATLDVYGKEVDVIVSHNGQEEDVRDRELQTKELARIMRESTNPFVFLGYVVTEPLKGNYHILMDGGNVNDIDPTDDDRWCEYVAYRGLKRTGYARVSHGDITDTEIQIGKFQVLDAYDNSTWTASYKRVTEDKVLPGLRFPPQFKGKGVRGHSYHVFDEPRYYD